MNKRWRKAILIIATLALSATLLIWISQNNLSDLKWLRPHTSIKSDLLTLIEGKNYNEVLAILKDNNFTILSASDRRGYMSGDKRPLGDMHIYTTLGGYRMFYVRTDIGAWLAFDQDGHLLSIEIVEHKDSL